MRPGQTVRRGGRTSPRTERTRPGKPPGAQDAQNQPQPCDLREGNTLRDKKIVEEHGHHSTRETMSSRRSPGSVYAKLQTSLTSRNNEPSAKD